MPEPAHASPSPRSSRATRSRPGPAAVAEDLRDQVPALRSGRCTACSATSAADAGRRVTLVSQLVESGRTAAGLHVSGTAGTPRPGPAAKGFVEANGELVALYESLSDAQLRDRRIDLGYLPEPDRHRRPGVDAAQ